MTAQRVHTGAGVQTLVIPDWLPAQLANGPHGHWATRQKLLRIAQKMLVLMARQADLQPVVGRVKATIVLVFPQHRRRDTDNLYSRVKGLVDGLVRGGFIGDDSTDVLELVVRAEVRPGIKATEITLEAVE